MVFLTRTGEQGFSFFAKILQLTDPQLALRSSTQAFYRYESSENPRITPKLPITKAPRVPTSNDTEQFCRYSYIHLSSAARHFRQLVSVLIMASAFIWTWYDGNIGKF